MQLLIRPHPELWLFLLPRRRRARFELDVDATASLGHVVQALGVPLTEVGALAVDDAPAGPADRLHDGATVDIGPVARPKRLPDGAGFLLDVHLGTLARRLRVLGVDTAYRNHADDDVLVRWAAQEGRVLLTQDRGLLMRRALHAGAYVRGARPADQLADVLGRFAPRLAPWTRCTACNGELAAVSKDEVADRLEPGTRRRYDRFSRCGSCGRVYWRGAHGRRLDAVVDVALRAAPPRRAGRTGDRRQAPRPRAGGRCRSLAPLYSSAPARSGWIVRWSSIAAAWRARATGPRGSTTTPRTLPCSPARPSASTSTARPVEPSRVTAVRSRTTVPEPGVSTLASSRASCSAARRSGPVVRSTSPHAVSSVTVPIREWSMRSRSSSYTGSCSPSTTGGPYLSPTAMSDDS